MCNSHNTLKKMKFKLKNLKKSLFWRLTSEFVLWNGGSSSITYQKEDCLPGWMSLPSDSSFWLVTVIKWAWRSKSKKPGATMIGSCGRTCDHCISFERGGDHCMSQGGEPSSTLMLYPLHFYSTLARPHHHKDYDRFEHCHSSRHHFDRLVVDSIPFHSWLDHQMVELYSMMKYDVFVPLLHGRAIWWYVWDAFCPNHIHNETITLSSHD